MLQKYFSWTQVTLAQCDETFCRFVWIALWVICCEISAVALGFNPNRLAGITLLCLCPNYKVYVCWVGVGGGIEIHCFRQTLFLNCQSEDRLNTKYLSFFVFCSLSLNILFFQTVQKKVFIYVYVFPHTYRGAWN